MCAHTQLNENDMTKQKQSQLFLPPANLVFHLHGEAGIMDAVANVGHGFAMILFHGLEEEESKGPSHRLL